MNDPAQPQALQGRRILIVEDEWFIVTELVEFLTSNGAEVVGPVSSLADGLAFAEVSDLFDSAILNIALHDQYSYPLADALRERGIPFAFASGIDDWAIPRAYADVPYISKPYEVAAVVKALWARSPAFRRCLTTAAPENDQNWLTRAIPCPLLAIATRKRTVRKPPSAVMQILIAHSREKPGVRRALPRSQAWFGTSRYLRFQTPLEQLHRNCI